MMLTAKNNLIYADDYDQLARELCDHDNTPLHTADFTFSKINESSHSLVRLFSQHSTSISIIFNRLLIFTVNQ